MERTALSNEQLLTSSDSASTELSLIQADILSVIRTLLQRPDFTAQDSFFEGGGTSADAVQLQTHIQQHYGVELKFLTLFRYPTAEQLALILRGQQHQPDAPTLFRMRPAQQTGPDTPVLAFVGTRGFIFLDYLGLAAEIDPKYEVIYLDWKDLDRDQYLRPQVDAFTAGYHQLLVDFCQGRPLVLAGICDGALLAAELPAKFPADTRPPIVILDTRAYSPERKTGAYYLLRLKLFWAHPWKTKWAKIRKHLRLFSDKRSYTATPVPPELSKTAHKSWVGGLTMYQVPTNIHLIRGIHSDVDEAGNLPGLGWRDLTLGTFSSTLVSGTHETLFKESHVEAVAEAINGFIAQEMQAKPETI